MIIFHIEHTFPEITDTSELPETIEESFIGTILSQHWCVVLREIYWVVFIKPCQLTLYKRVIVLAIRTCILSFLHELQLYPLNTLIFARNSEANASEFLENIEEMFLL